MTTEKFLQHNNKIVKTFLKLNHKNINSACEQNNFDKI